MLDLHRSFTSLQALEVIEVLCRSSVLARRCLGFVEVEPHFLDIPIIEAGPQRRLTQALAVAPVR